MLKLRKNKKGFTLIELIVVIAILAILAAIAIPSFIGITNEAEQKVALANARNIATAINTWNMLNPDETALTSSTAQTTLEADNLWPEGMEAADVTNAWTYITISGRFATVSEASSTPAPTS